MRLANTAVEKTLRAKITDTTGTSNPERQLIASCASVAAPIDVLPVQHPVVADHQVALRPSGDAERYESDHVVLEHLAGSTIPRSASAPATARIIGARCTARLQNGALNS